MPKIQLITFDLDDTLWHTAPVLERAERVLYDWLAASVPAITDQHSVDSLREHRLVLLQQQPELRHHISQWRRLSLQYLLQELGYREGEAQQFAEQAFAVFLDARHRVDLFDGVADTLRALHRNFRIGAITNGNADVFRLPVGEYFDFAIRAEHVGCSKPDVRIFQAALDAAGCAGEQSLHIGDHPVYDIEGARDAGMHALQARLLADTEVTNVDGFEHWRELPALLEKTTKGHPSAQDAASGKR